MQTETVNAYRGDATLIPESGGREYPCFVRIRVTYDISPDLAATAHVRDTHRWDADVAGDRPMSPRPPYGAATLRLPDGSTGEAMLMRIAPRPDSLTWDGALAGIGEPPKLPAGDR